MNQVHGECPHCTSEERQAVKKTGSFDQIADYAIAVLARMPQPICELCGPTSTGGFGCPKKNILLFDRCVKELRIRDLNPFDQVPLQDGFDHLVLKWYAAGNTGYCMPILETVYRRIFESGHVTRAYFLPGWEKSFGTTFERNLVTRLGIEVIEFPLDWYEAIMSELRTERGL